MTTNRTLARVFVAGSYAALFSTAAPWAHAQLVEVNWDAGGHFERQASVAPGKFLEVCDKLKPGTQVQWKFKGSAPTNFNIHYHEGKDVHFPAKEDGSSSSNGTLNVSSEQAYCWMWSNKGQAEVQLSLELHKQP